MKLKVAVIGLGKQGVQEYLPAIKLLNNLELVAVCDVDINTVNKISTIYGVKGYYSIDELLKNVQLNLVILCLPHNQYLSAIEKISAKGIHIFKEKPFAIDKYEAAKIYNLATNNNISICVATQRRCDPIYIAGKEMLNSIGKIYLIEGKYTFNISRLDEGWRSSKISSGGGAILDMGYHLIDIMVWYFDLPATISVKTTKNNKINQNYDVEDTATLQFDYYNNEQPYSEKTVGNFLISRNYRSKKEVLKVMGKEGYVIIKPSDARLFNRVGNEIQSVKRENVSHIVPLYEQLRNFVEYLLKNCDKFAGNYLEHFKHLSIIEAAYTSNENSTIVKVDKRFLDKAQNKKINSQPKLSDYSWPIITHNTRYAVLKQLDKSVSIYDKSGIIKKFEDKFSAYHNRKYALLSNSGTNAIFAMYEGINLQPGDEVIVPAYTFFATVSPLMYMGAKPVFCDCLPDGNIDPNQIRAKVNKKTKAVVITHMWGIPCDMDEIVLICREYKLVLLEDCSHAHGAKYKGKLVGTFGKAAAWSLQGQKIITGGEGGILLTDDEDLHTRALLQGHYNKRCKQEINKQHPLYKFSLTGFGLKFRSHPLAVSIAHEQFKHLDKWLTQKAIFAGQIIKGLSNIPFLEMPKFDHKNPSWYAFIMQYKPERISISLEQFHVMLQGEGLTEVDLPNSTTPLYNLPLFKDPSIPLSRYFKNSSSPDTNSYQGSDKFYKNAIKLPVWCRPEDQPIVDKYIQVIKKVSEMCLNNDFSLLNPKMVSKL